MDTSITIALITGIISLVVVIISSLVTLITGRRASRAEKEIEAYKEWLEHVYQGIDTKRNAVEARLQALGDACKHIQTVRDAYRSINGSAKTKREQQKILESAVKSLYDLYASAHYTLPDLERGLLHNAKDLANQLKTLIDSNTQEDNSKEAANCLSQLQNIQTILVKDYEKWHMYYLQSYEEPTKFDATEKLYEPEASINRDGEFHKTSDSI